MNRYSIPTLASALLAVAAASALAAPKTGSAGAARSHDYPTTERVVFVEDCMLDHPGPRYEMLTKCSCTIDTIARSVDAEDFVDMSTAAKANSIGGERGNTIRDTEVLQKDIRRYRELVSSAKKACFIEGEPVRR